MQHFNRHIPSNTKNAPEIAKITFGESSGELDSFSLPTVLPEALPFSEGCVCLGVADPGENDFLGFFVVVGSLEIDGSFGGGSCWTIGSWLEAF